MSKRGRVYANVSEPPAKMGSAPGPGRRQPREEEIGGGERWQRAADRRKSPFFATAAAGQSNSSSDAGAAASIAAGSGRQGGGGRGAASSRGARSAATGASAGGRYAAAPTGKFAGELNADALYRDEADRQTLENMNEFEREAELARRYEELVRERQRAELLRRQDRGGAEERTSGRLGEALSDIRARRARQKQLQQRPTSDEEEEEEEGAEEESLASSGQALLPTAAAAEEDSEAMSVSLSSSEEEGEAVSARISVDEGARPPAAAETPGAAEAVEVKVVDAAIVGGVGVDDGAPAAADVVVAAAEDAATGDLKAEVAEAGEQRQPAIAAAAAAQPSVSDEAIVVPQREEEVRGDDLFEEDRVDTDEQRKKELARRMLQRVSLDLLNAARLSIERLTLMLEHPQAERFVCGCYVKVPQQQQQRGLAAAGNNSNNTLLLAAAAAATPCWVCQIVGLKPCDPYPVRLPTAAAAASCSYRLVLRLAPKAPARFDREFALTDLVSAPVTPSEFEDWKKKLEEFDTVEDVSRRIRMKLQMLKEFTFTDEDVQTILSRKREGSAAAVVQTSGSLLKQLMFVKHQLDTLHYSLSSAATAASSRKDLKEKLQVLQEKKADLETRLARSKAAAGGQRELLHRLSVEARLARRREHAAPLLLTRSSHRRPSNSSSSSNAGSALQEKHLRHWQRPPGQHALGRPVQCAAVAAAGAAEQRPPADRREATPGEAFLASRSSTGRSDRPAAATALPGGSSTRTDARAGVGAEGGGRRQRSALEEATAASSAATLPAAAARSSSGPRSPPAGAGAGRVVWRAADNTATAAAATSHAAQRDVLLPATEASGSADPGTPVGSAEEAWRVLLQGTRQQQRAWMQTILQSQRAAGKFRIEKSIPPPAPYASIVSLLPYSPPPAGRGLLISLEEYKQQVAQLANLQLAG